MSLNIDNKNTLPTIIYLHPHFTLPGGAGKVVLETATRLQNKGYKIVIVCGQVWDEYRRQYPDLNFQSIRSPLSSSFLFWILFPVWQMKIRKALDRYPGAILFPQVFPANWWAFLYERTHKNYSCVWYCQEPSAFIHIRSWIKAINNPIKRMCAYVLNPIFTKLDLQLAKQADYIIANSNYSKTIIESIYGHKKVIVIYPGVSVFKEKKAHENKEHYLLTVSRLTKFKNVDLIIRTFSTINDMQLRLKIVGRGEELHALMRLTEDLGVRARTDFLQTPDDKYLETLYQKAKIVLFASQNEPFGLVPIEAMANGTAVIADRSGGPLETIKEGETGLFYTYGDAKDLKEKILFLLSENNYQRYGEKAITWVNQRFTWDVTAENLDRLFASIAIN